MCTLLFPKVQVDRVQFFEYLILSNQKLKIINVLSHKTKKKQQIFITERESESRKIQGYFLKMTSTIN